MKLELQLLRGLMGLALIASSAVMAAYSHAPLQPVAHPTLACPSATPPATSPIDGIAGMMAPAWRAHLPALIGRRSA